MRWLIQYIRSCFCKHEWAFEEEYVRAPYSGRSGPVVSVTCEKCAYHKSYWKFSGVS